MGRRRRRYREDNDGGLVEAVAGIAAASPPVGFIIGLICCGVGSYLQWGNPKAMMGFAPILGVCFNIVGIFAMVMAAVYFLKGLLSFRPPSIPRPRFQSFRRFSHTPMAVPTQPPRAQPAPMESVPPAQHAIWTLERVQSLSWMEFESLIAQLFRQQGYLVEERGRMAAQMRTGDGGVDLVLTHHNAPGAHYLVQCKQYKVWDVGEPKVREFYGAMAAWRTTCEGIIITCGRFSQPAKQFAAGKPIRLIDGEGLLRMLNQNNPVKPPVAVAAPPIVQAVSAPPAAVRVQASIPLCPRCGSPMVKRVSPAGQWQPFWGCSTYPRCRERINIA